jgi:hypothetical protein
VLWLAQSEGVKFWLQVSGVSHGGCPSNYLFPAYRSRPRPGSCCFPGTQPSMDTQPAFMPERLASAGFEEQCHKIIIY